MILCSLYSWVLFFLFYVFLSFQTLIIRNTVLLTFIICEFFCVFEIGSIDRYHVAFFAVLLENYSRIVVFKFNLFDDHPKCGRWSSTWLIWQPLGVANFILDSKQYSLFRISIVHFIHKIKNESLKEIISYHKFFIKLLRLIIMSSKYVKQKHTINLVEI